MQDPQPQNDRANELTLRARRTAPDEVAASPKAILFLDDEGGIEHVSDRARHILDLRNRSLTGQSFFGSVHPQDLKRVVHDLTEMVLHDKKHATWLLQLKTGLGPWQWFKIEATNQLDHEHRAGIVLQLFERGWGSSR